MSDKPLLSIRNLKKHYPIYGGLLFRKVATVYAVDGISFEVNPGETFGLVGESGCGKSTLTKAILRLDEPTDGEIIFDGWKLRDLDKKNMRVIRRDMQMIFQDPCESMNSRWTVGQILEEPYIIHNVGSPSERRKRVRELLDVVGLPQSAADRFPHEFSGGQRQRIGIGRAIALQPKLVFCDEPVSALDVSIQSQILNLLLDLQREFGLAYVFIAHDLAVVKHVSDTIGVMYLGKMVETASARELYRRPLHPYTQALIAAIPVPQPHRAHCKRALSGEVPSPRNPPAGCRFHTRCPFAEQRCSQDEPLLRQIETPEGGRHLVACHFAEQFLDNSCTS